jgi:hypothetical protein
MTKKYCNIQCEFLGEAICRLMPKIPSWKVKAHHNKRTLCHYNITHEQYDTPNFYIQIYLEDGMFCVTDSQELFGWEDVAMDYPTNSALTKLATFIQEIEPTLERGYEDAHILDAITKGYGSRHKSTRWEVWHDNKEYVARSITSKGTTYWVHIEDERAIVTDEDGNTHGEVPLANPNVNKKIKDILKVGSSLEMEENRNYKRRQEVDEALEIVRGAIDYLDLPYVVDNISCLKEEERQRIKKIITDFVSK